jgi:hypothetical protein
MESCLAANQARTTQEDTHMPDSPRYPDTGDDTGAGPGGESTTGTPGWVKLSVIIIGVLVLLVVIKLLTGGGGFGH